MTSISKADLVLVNKVRAYERSIAARERALAAAEKGVADDRVLSKRYGIEFVFAASDFSSTQKPTQQTKTVTVDRDAKWFSVRRVAFTLSVIGSDGNGNAIFYTLSPTFRPYQMSGLLSVRDSFRDRSWSNVPLPDAVYANNQLAERLFRAPARLPGGTVLSATYAPQSNQTPLAHGSTAASPLGIDTINTYRVFLSFIGVEVRT